MRGRRVILESSWHRICDYDSIALAQREADRSKVCVRRNFLLYLVVREANNTSRRLYDLDLAKTLRAELLHLRTMMLAHYLHMTACVQRVDNLLLTGEEPDPFWEPDEVDHDVTFGDIVCLLDMPNVPVELTAPLDPDIFDEWDPRNCPICRGPIEDCTHGE